MIADTGFNPLPFQDASQQRAKAALSIKQRRSEWLTSYVRSSNRLEEADRMKVHHV